MNIPSRALFFQFLAAHSDHTPHNFPLGVDTGSGLRESSPVGPMWAMNLTKLV